MDVLTNPNDSAKDLTKREYFAALFFHAMLNNTNFRYEVDHITKFAILDADNLIKALNETQQ